MSMCYCSTGNKDEALARLKASQDDEKKSKERNIEVKVKLSWGNSGDREAILTEFPLKFMEGKTVKDYEDEGCEIHIELEENGIKFQIRGGAINEIRAVEKKLAINLGIKEGWIGLVLS